MRKKASCGLCGHNGGMFAFWKKRSPAEKLRRASVQERAAYADALTMSLEVQLTSAGVSPSRWPGMITKFELSPGDINCRAVGYVFGFVDAALQAVGASTSDPDLGFPLLFAIFHNLVSTHAERYVNFGLDNEQDPKFALGKLTGGQNYVDYVARKQAGHAMGLARIVLAAARD